MKENNGSFPFVPPPLARYAPPVTEHVPLHSNSLCKNMRVRLGVQITCAHQAGGGGKIQNNIYARVTDQCGE